jgi:hypothetical protein
MALSVLDFGIFGLAGILGKILALRESKQGGNQAGRENTDFVVVPGHGIVEGHTAEANILLIPLDALHGLLISSAGFEVRILFSDCDKTGESAVESGLVSLDLLDSWIGRSSYLPGFHNLLEGLAFILGILAGKFNESLDSIITADLLDIDLPQCVFAELVGLDERILDGNGPQDNEGDYRKDNDKSC